MKINDIPLQLNKSEQVKKIGDAKAYLGEKKDKKALKILKNIVESNPSDDEAWLYLGIAKRRIEELNGAIDCFKTATELNPSLIEAWGLLAITFLDKNKIELAEEILKKAEKINPYNSQIQFYQKNLIQIYSKFGPFF